MDRSEFTANVKATQGALRRFLVALCCGDSALADDIAQEAYLKAYLTPDPVRDFRAWVFRIALNAFISHRRAARPADSVDAAGTLHAAETSDSAFRYQALYRALAALSPKERTAVVLFYMEGYSVKDIAAELRLSADAVKQQLFRGRQHLKLLLNPDDAHDE